MTRSAHCKITFGAIPPIEGIARFATDLRIEASEMKTWHPDRIQQFFQGIAMAIAAADGDIPGPIATLAEDKRPAPEG